MAELKVPATSTFMDQFQSLRSSIYEKGNWHINTTNIQPGLLKGQKIHAIQQEELQQSLKQVGKLVTDIQEMKTEDTAKYLHQLTTMTRIVSDLLLAETGLHQLPISLQGRGNVLVQLPLEVVDVTLQALTKSVDYWSECEIGLKLAKNIMNVEHLAKIFVQSGGLEQIYDIFLHDEVFSNIQVAALEVVQVSLNYEFACERYLHSELMDYPYLAEKVRVLNESVLNQLPENVVVREKEKERQRSRSRSRGGKKSKRGRNEKERKKEKEKERKKGSKRGRSRERDSRRSREKKEEKEKETSSRYKDLEEMPQVRTGEQLVLNLLRRSKYSRIQSLVKSINNKVQIYNYNILL